MFRNRRFLQSAIYGAAAGGSDAAATTAFLARADAITTVGATERAAYKTLINGLVADGDFTKLDVLYIFATDTRAHALLNLVSSSYTGTEVGYTSNFAADHGYTGDASTFYIDTGFNPAGAGGNYTGTSSSLGTYVIASRTTGQYWVSIGGQSGGGAVFQDLLHKFTDTFAYAQFSGNANTSPTAMTDAWGMQVGVRTSATAMALWKNGVSQASTANATGGALGSNLYVFAYNDNGTPVHWSGDQMSAAFAGSGTINVANVSSRINAYMTALSINVY